MPRPTKDPTLLRKRWDALYVTDVERADISITAKNAGLSVGRYLVARHAQSTLIRRADWAQNIQLLSTVSNQLEDVARAFQHHTSPLGGSSILPAMRLLLELERKVQSHTMPWLRADPHDEDLE